MDKYFYVKNLDELKNFNNSKIIFLSKVVKKTENGFFVENDIEVIGNFDVEENDEIRVFGNFVDNKVYAEIIQKIKNLNILKNIFNLYYEAGAK